ncbi:sensor histidine kinase [Paenibacillus soyae]|uniref:Sensor histidine kinase n=1 Tax=Paenibacillus soyae TaxID=2969249 RepID=A0A9X2SBY8_9BACL|nr:sensor histidine kinase [Paenibacillus soyae]MCR2807711.1 sensor histidine kinase [Paenibacillus soyae]
MESKKRTYLNRITRFLLLRDRSLMTKLIFFSVLLVVFPMMMVGVISYRESSRTLENEAKRSSWQIIEQVKIYVEDYLRDFEIDALKIVNHPDTVAFLKLKTYEEVMDANIVPNVRDVLKNSAYSQSDVLNITLILDGVQTINSAVQSGVSTVQGIEDEHWYDSIPVMGRPKVYSRVIHANGREEPVISVVKRIANPQTLEPFGMLVIDLNYKRLHDVARKIKLGENGEGYLSILDEQGYMVYHPNISLIGTKADDRMFQFVNGKESGSFVAAVDGADALVTFSRSDTLQWQVMTTIPYDALMKSNRVYIGRMIFGTTSFFIVIALLLSAAFAASLVKPIRQLYRHMRRVESGDFTWKVPVDSADEIGMLSSGFNKMGDRLSQLVDEVYLSKLKETELALRQRETELKMLQAQINPHFLYNSLDTIRGMALEHDIEDIGAMAASLARLLRYNVKDSGSKVTVQQEVEIAQIYLRIQQFRFEERLEYDIDLPEWALSQRMTKFTLQPIVENCIVHGMERTASTTTIRLTARRLSEDRFEVIVFDNGPGMSPESLERLRCRLDCFEAPSDTHIGSMNVQRRIRHVFGDRYGLQVDSVEGEWTEVRVVLPYESC